MTQKINKNYESSNFQTSYKNNQSEITDLQKIISSIHYIKYVGPLVKKIKSVLIVDLCYFEKILNMKHNL